MAELEILERVWEGMELVWDEVKLEILEKAWKETERARARESISYNVLQARNVHDGARKLCNVGQMSLLSTRSGRRTPEQGRC